MFICTTIELTFTSRKSESGLKQFQGSATSRSYTRLSLPTQNTGSLTIQASEVLSPKGPKKKKKKSVDKKASTKKRRRMLYLLPSFDTDKKTSTILTNRRNRSTSKQRELHRRRDKQRSRETQEHLRGASALGSLWLQALASSSDGQEVVMIGSDGNKKRYVVVGDGPKASSG